MRIMFKKHVHIVFEYSQYTRGFEPSVKSLSAFVDTLSATMWYVTFIRKGGLRTVTIL